MTEALRKRSSTSGDGAALPYTAVRSSSAIALGLARDVLLLTKPRLSLLVVATTAGGMWLAPEPLPYFAALMVITATSLLVAGAQSLNSYFEREIDAKMTRTAQRPLPAGRLPPRVALVLGIGAAGVSLPLLALYGNGITAALGALAYASYVGAYTPLKRYSTWALPVGAIPGAIPPAMGWTAATGSFDAVALALFGILFFWQLPHFFAISIYLRDDYAKASLKVFALVHGERATKVGIVLSSAALVPVTLALVPLGVAGPTYGIVSAVLGAAFFTWSLTGLRTSAGERWARAFFSGSLIYLTLLLLALALARIGHQVTQ